MRENLSDALIMSDGGLASLAAVWREIARAGHARAGVPSVRVREELAAVVAGRGSGGPMIWAVPGLSPQAESATCRQAELSGFELAAKQAGVRADGCRGLGGSGGVADSALLLSACEIAVACGLGRVVWPVHLGPDAGDLAVDAYDRANVVSHLSAIDLPRHGGAVTIRVEAPFVELSDIELLDLAIDLDAPVPRPVRGAAAFGEGPGACRWCERQGERHCGVCGPCGRWGVAWATIDPAGVLAAG